jgi:DNA polymerase-3 subunit gamma/tau
MLGLSDRGRLFDLLERTFGGAAAEALAGLASLCRDGADPIQVLSDLAEVVHIVARAKIVGADDAGEGLPAEERRRASELASKLSTPLLSRAWQMLLKGLEEAAKAPDARAAAEMVLIRLAHTADLPSPDEVIRMLGGNPQVAAKRDQDGRSPSKQIEPRNVLVEPPLEAREDNLEEAGDDGEVREPPAAGPLVPRSFADVVALVGKHREARLKVHLEEHVSLVKFDPAGRVEIHLLAGAPHDIVNELRDKLSRWTGTRWVVTLSNSAGERPLGELQRQREAAEIETLKRHPAVMAVLEEFPEARMRVRKPRPREDG